ncbi:CDP-alcohol phosphatidyltransferase family protein [Sphingomonas sp. KR1UV-12]|uniref:CDP-alcohol phosphatidyltransferase family protein n=1 Tax=Sphingomonas aurea TaxID=3063994 RepID=A0ABT9EN30_9SPHN|nr:CDP-alcohol phosphatidyltransferase family protein [Sphingomonas sp. KR1UV-12]MDP1028365.1 CDP-alcohol phosphatidyltransferase family protein [Sphingomonas sp. KR1UV-12]
MIHPLGRRLLPHAVAYRISANMVSITGLLIGTAAALCYARFDAWPFAVLGLVLSVAWLVADGLDGMIARATGTASPLGRALDGVCDHGVFILIYVAMALAVGTAQGWALAVVAGAAHAMQSNLYEGERARYHRRAKGIARLDGTAAATGPIVRAYDWLAGTPERLAMAFERRLASSADRKGLGARYAARAVAPMRLLALQTANVRVLAIFLACLLAEPRLFWWFEIGPLTLAAVIGLAWHRRVERHFIHSTHFAPADAPSGLFVKEQGQ